MTSQTKLVQPEDVTNDIVPLKPRKATVIDGMAIVQAMGKPSWVMCSMG